MCKVIIFTYLYEVFKIYLNITMFVKCIPQVFLIAKVTLKVLDRSPVTKWNNSKSEVTVLLVSYDFPQVKNHTPVLGFHFL